MNDNQMRIAIAECVFEHLKTEKRLVAHQNKTHELLYGGHDSFGLWIWMEPDGRLYGMNYDTLEELERGSISEIAERNNYFRDLNAIHSAVSNQPIDWRQLFQNHLNGLAIRNGKILVEVGAREWAECFLTTEREWKST